jgi:hypothetical protein
MFTPLGMTRAAVATVCLCLVALLVTAGDPATGLAQRQPGTKGVSTQPPGKDKGKKDERKKGNPADKAEAGRHIVLIQQALSSLQTAQQQLQAAGKGLTAHKNYHGFRAKALHDVDHAIKEAHSALKVAQSIGLH